MSDASDLTTGATLVENGVTCCAGGDLSHAAIHAFNNYFISTWQGSGILADDFENFSYTNDEWRAQLFVTFTPQQNPDYVEFTVSCFSFCGGFPTSYVEISYEGAEGAPPSD